MGEETVWNVFLLTTDSFSFDVARKLVFYMVHPFLTSAADLATAGTLVNHISLQGTWLSLTNHVGYACHWNDLQKSLEVYRKCHSLRGHMISDYCSIVTMALSCIVYHIHMDWKSQNLYTPCPIGILQRCLVLEKLEWFSYHMPKKVCWYVKLLRYNTGTWQNY